MLDLDHIAERDIMNRVEVQIGKGSRSYRVCAVQGKNPEINIG